MRAKTYMSKINLQAETTNSVEQEEQREKTDMLRSIGKLCVSFSAVRDRELSVPVLADVWRRRTRNSHIRRCTLDGPAREEIPPDEDRRRGTR